MKTTSIIIFFLILYSGILPQQTTFQDSLLDKMAGKWILKGTIGGQQTTHDINASWILQHQYLQFTEVSREKDTNGNALYEAQVTIGWDDKLNKYVCLWLDITGGGGLKGELLGYAEKKDNEIAFLFNVFGSGFHTTFIYNKSDDSWNWKMDGEENGQLQPFARVKLTRL